MSLPPTWAVFWMGVMCTFLRDPRRATASGVPRGPAGSDRPRDLEGASVPHWAAPPRGAAESETEAPSQSFAAARPSGRVHFLLRAPAVPGKRERPRSEER